VANQFVACVSHESDFILVVFRPPPLTSGASTNPPQHSPPFPAPTHIHAPIPNSRRNFPTLLTLRVGGMSPGVRSWYLSFSVTTPLHSDSPPPMCCSAPPYDACFSPISYLACVILLVSLPARWSGSFSTSSLAHAASPYPFGCPVSLPLPLPPLIGLFQSHSICHTTALPF